MKRRTYFFMGLALLLMAAHAWGYYELGISKDEVFIYQERLQEEILEGIQEGLSAEQSLKKYQEVLARDPTAIDSWLLLGQLFQKMKRRDEAFACYQKLIDLDFKDSSAPSAVLLAAWRGLGQIYLAKEQWQEAKAALEKSRLHGLEQPHLDYELALCHYHLGCYSKALCLLEKILEIDREQPLVNLALGCTYLKLEQYQAAITHLEIALIRAEDKSLVYTNLGYAISLLDLYRWQEAFFYFDKAIAIDPDNWSAYSNMGLLRVRLGQWPQALLCYQKAVALQPQNEDLLCNLGLVFWYLERYDEAESTLLRALELKPGCQRALIKLAAVYQAQDKKEQSIALFEKIDPQSEDYPQAVAGLYCQFRQLCRWEQAVLIEAALDRVTRESLVKGGFCEETPFNNLLRSMNPSLNQAVAQNWSAHCKNQLTHPPFYPKFSRCKSNAQERKTLEKLTIGYLSSDFFDHATLHLIAGLFRLHDREKFDIIAYSYGQDDGSRNRQQVQSCCTRFVDIAHLSDDQAAQQIYEDGVDILVDLKGMTRLARPAIAMYRPSPVQMAYLGFPGSSGSDCFDYILTDRIVTPESEQPYYDEKFLYMSTCYQINDNQQPISSQPVTRDQLGLPEKGFVFASFNDLYKLDAELFNSWMNLLCEVPGSILWLYSGRPSDTPLIKQELYSRALARGVDNHRIVFAGHISKGDHLNRLRLADLVLDTRVCNGHTTTSDALWAGVPVVAIQGAHFASRVSSSLLSALGIGELITHSLSEYEALAKHLATHPSDLSSWRKKIAQNRLIAPLFDTERFTRELESHYKSICIPRDERGIGHSLE